MSDSIQGRSGVVGLSGDADEGTLGVREVSVDGIQTSGVSELVLEVTDLAAAERFYAGVLGLPVVERWTERQAIWVMAGTRTRIGLWTPQVGIAGGQGGVHVHFALHVDEAEFPTLVRRLEAHGLPVHLEDFGKRGDAAYVTDPDGNVVEFWTWDVGEHLDRHDGTNPSGNGV